RAVAVERHALQRLDQGEEQEERGGQQPEIGGGGADVALEIGGEDGINAAEDVGEEIGEGERQEDPQQQLRRRWSVSGHVSFGATYAFLSARPESYHGA